MDNPIGRKLVSLISLSMRAGRIVTGEEGCLKTLQNGRGRLVFVATDASDNTRKKFSDKSRHYGAPCYCLFSKDEIEAAIGKTNRATIVIICENFAERMIQLLNDLHIEEYQFS